LRFGFSIFPSLLGLLLDTEYQVMKSAVNLLPVLLNVLRGMWKWILISVTQSHLDVTSRKTENF